ncbi:MAG TPA: hypothetical protein VJW20_01910 [Candidatus Angelobacter sp.]|nr:hypothetical protein [Candidatus Angelobacter sp.]
MKKSAAYPRDCALLIAVPVTREKFLADLEPGHDGDFIQAFCRKQRLGPDGLWSAYEPVASLTLDVGSEAHRRGVTVMYDATLSEFAERIPRAKVITLVAHWRSAWFREREFKNAGNLKDCQLQQLEQATHVSWLLPAAELARRLNDFLLEGMEPAAKDALMAQAQSSEEPDGETRWGALTRGIRAIHQKRLALEKLAPGFFNGGSAVEFADRMCSVEEVVRAVPADFSGVMDLTICNSILLGEEIRRKCAHAVVMMNAAEASLDFRMALYRQIIRTLAKTPQSFTEAGLQTRKRL